MNFKFIHANINITNIERSLKFYEEALGLKLSRTYEPEDKSFVLSYLTDEMGIFEIELTWLREHQQAYDLGENESHLAFEVEDFEAAHSLHEEMGVICFENKDMGIYFIEDPDGYWLEIVPAHR